MKRIALLLAVLCSFASADIVRPVLLPKPYRPIDFKKVVEDGSFENAAFLRFKCTDTGYITPTIAHEGTCQIYVNGSLAGTVDALTSELLTNPAYPSDLTGWTVTGGGWAASGSAFVGTGDSGTNKIGQDCGLTIGTPYLIEYQVTQNSLTTFTDFYITSNSIFGGHSSAVRQQSGDVGTYAIVLFANNVGHTIDFELNIDATSDSGTITIDYFSVKEIGETSIAITRSDDVKIVFSNPETVTYIDLDGDALRGDVSQFSQFQNLTELTMPDMDPKGFLSDTQLYDNYDFATGDTTDWTTLLAGGSTFAVSGTAATLTRGTSDAFAYQNKVSAGVAYRIKVNCTAVSGTFVSVYNLNTAEELIDLDALGVGTYQIDYFATASHNIGLRCGVDGSSVTVDYLSVKAITNSVTNGGFDADTDWTKGTGWTIAGGVADNDGSQAGSSALTQNGVFTSGLTYRMTGDFTLASSTFGLWIGGSQFLPPLITSSGSDFRYIDATVSGSYFLEALAATVGTADNLLVLPWPDQNIGGVSSLVSPRTTSLVIDAASNVAWVDGAFDQGISLETLTIDAANWTTAQVNAAMASLRVATDGGMTTATITFTNVPEPTGQGDTDVTYIGNAGNTISVP